MNSLLKVIRQKYINCCAVNEEPLELGQYRGNIESAFFDIKLGETNAETLFDDTVNSITCELPPAPATFTINLAPARLGEGAFICSFSTTSQVPLSTVEVFIDNGSQGIFTNQQLSLNTNTGLFEILFNPMPVVLETSGTHSYTIVVTNTQGVVIAYPLTSIVVE